MAGNDTRDTDEFGGQVPLWVTNWPSVDGDAARDRDRGNMRRIELEPLPLAGPSLAPGVGRAFEVVGEVSHGGQARLYAVRPARGCVADSAGREGDLLQTSAHAGSAPSHLALKLFSTEDAARREWDVLQIHKNEATVPLAYMIGVLGDACATSFGGRYAIVMEHIDGPTLQELIDDAEYRLNVTLEDALRTIAPVVRFCANAEDSRALDVHRDIKPANLICARDGRVRIVDFGISAGATGSHEARGTYGYAAPEMWACDPNAHTADPRVDTYGIGATLVAMLDGSGRPPAYGEAETALGQATFRHDGALVEALVRDVHEDLAKKRVANLTEAVARKAVELALAAMDAKVATRVREMLAADQALRPRPSELESILPLNEEHYRTELFNTAVIAGMRGGAPVRPVIPGYREEVAADQDFVVALSDFNCGFYGKAVPVLEKLAAAGDLNAMYYLGVCMRDGLGPFAGRDCTEEVAYYFSRAAEAGNVLAMNAYGQMLYEGRGVGRDEAEGRRLVELAAADDPAIGRTGFPGARAWLVEHAEK